MRELEEATYRGSEGFKPDPLGGITSSDPNDLWVGRGEKEWKGCNRRSEMKGEEE